MSVTEAPSVASVARRAQIVAATIEVIAEEGLSQASFARIARQAGLSSTRLISYHFAAKSELIAAVVQDVLTRIAAYVGQRIDAAEEADGQGNATAILRAYIEGNVAFIDTHRSHMQALLQIVLSGAGAGATPKTTPQTAGPQTAGPQTAGPQTAGPRTVPPQAPDPNTTGIPLEGLLRHGQSTGAFRDFDVPTVASAVQRAIEGLPFMLAAQPDLDCGRYARELADLFLRGVRSGSP